MPTAPDDIPLFKRLIEGRGGEVLVTWDELHYLRGLTDWDFEDLTRRAAESLEVVLLPLGSGTTRVRAVRSLPE